ncbi:hypothetical protein PK35_05900 [Tamlana nanhaiensis]|uniref:Sulfotransferase n=1 Tax=Neotamlana nanhaiensis TaxID=1382798 RepID=A0A0D7W2P3_9FLAO|nr:sulfotransferase family 2 domain-containing protein [Tamlana nanhaiensis]KJD33390.1 hypothetical protein PK35_05900 [Tamlana nanhaiensis]
MVISKNKKFIFIHIPKSAGTSIQSALELNLNNENHWAVSKTTKHQSLKDLITLYEHSNFLEKLVQDFSFLNYYKFAVVRNPFDRLLSLYNYLKKYEVRKEIKSVETFEEFIEKLEDENSWVSGLYSAKTQLSYLVDMQGVMSIDLVGRFENIPFFLNELEAKIDMKLELKQMNVSQLVKPSYRQVYSTYSRKIIEDKFVDDLNSFNYEF